MSDRARRDERGYALVACMLIASVGLVLVMAMAAQGTHLLEATGRDRQWNQALEVAEAGVERSVAEIAANMAYTGTGSTPVAAPGGEYETVITTPRRGWREVTSTGYVPRKSSANAVKRRIRVTYGPSRSFRYALFSAASLNVKNNGGVTGDVFANQSIVIEQNSSVTGSVVSATGSVELENGAEVREAADRVGGNVYSGGIDEKAGWGIRLAGGATIEGSARAQVDSCGRTQTLYNIDLANNATIEGDGVAHGQVTGGTVGRRVPYSCEIWQPTQDLPEYRYDPALYGAVSEWSSASQFMTGTSQRVSGVHHIVDPDPSVLIDMACKTIAGEFVLITNTRVGYGNACGSRPVYDGPSSAVVNIIVLNNSTTPPAIEIENQLELPDPSPAMLFYTPGLIDVKNNAEADGALYAGILSLKNNLEVSYDDRVERSLGFGPYQFERVSWVEVEV